MPCSPSAGEDAITGDTDKYLGPQDLKELGDDSLPAEGYVGFSLGARSARYLITPPPLPEVYLQPPQIYHEPAPFPSSS